MIAPPRRPIVNLSSQAGFVALPDRVGLLHDQGGDRSPYEVPGGRVGCTRHQRQRGRADVHPHAGHGEVARGRCVPYRARWRASRSAVSATRSTSRAPVVFLASPAAAMITGATLLIDGGFSAR